MEIIHRQAINANQELVIWCVAFSDALEEFTIITSAGKRIDVAGLFDVQPQNQIRVSIFTNRKRDYELSKTEANALGITSENVKKWKKIISDSTPVFA